MGLGITPAAPLAPGFYQLGLAGDASGGAFVLADPNGIALGTLTPGTRVQATGVIGDDPYYDPNLGLNPSADVDLYHFQIDGTGKYSLVAEVFAGRIGSPADPGVSLFRVDPVTQQLVLPEAKHPGIAFLAVCA